MTGDELFYMVMMIAIPILIYIALKVERGAAAAERKAEKLDQEVMNTLQKLKQSQKPLGGEFEKVLHDKKWELYERD